MSSQPRALDIYCLGRARLKVYQKNSRKAVAVSEEKIQERSVPIFQQPFSLPENTQALAGIAFGAAACRK